MKANVCLCAWDCVGVSGAAAVGKLDFSNPFFGASGPGGGCFSASGYNFRHFSVA